MSNGIQPLRPGANPYIQTGNVAPSAQQRPQTEAVHNAAPAPQSRLEGLSGDESKMIQDLFPENTRTTMRLYGPRGNDHEVTARGVGGRLDLKA